MSVNKIKTFMFDKILKQKFKLLHFSQLGNKNMVQGFSKSVFCWISVEMVICIWCALWIRLKEESMNDAEN